MPGQISKFLKNKTLFLHQIQHDMGSCKLQNLIERDLIVPI